MTFFYFAYGSNMLPARLLGGKATLVGAPDSAIPGVTFEVDLSEREQLDQHEGVGFGYKRDDDFVVEGSTVPTSS